ncbi:MAG: argininosuccinate lyase [Pyrinomonadaceae bacterium]|nr:argininosuccinate lyase [Pyrinomonadaceae bacterium]
MNEQQKLWGGRFTVAADQEFARFNASFSFDRRLFKADVQASIAHCAGLKEAGVLTAAEARGITEGLEKILVTAESNPNYFDELPVEDVHSFIEARLIELTGDVGRKLHTGRSRNDQVATALRLTLRDEIDALASRVREAQGALLASAERYTDVVIPGYTHLQRAQPVLWAHWCLAYFEMLERDAARLVEVRGRTNILPLGSAALAGTSYAINREHVARSLGFQSVSRNSIDAVSDRDFCIELAGVAALIMMHLSRLAEDLILYATLEFGFIELDDRVATGSSLMPQKKNPDALELVRGKAGRVYGHLTSLLVMMKGLPLAYNKDMQEDKEAIFDAVDTVRDSLQVTAIVLHHTSVREARGREAATHGYLNATELADYLVRRGVAFRTAHETVGRIVLYAAERGRELHKLSLDELLQFNGNIEASVYDALSLEETLRTKSQIGGTSPTRVEEALLAARERLKT